MLMASSKGNVITQELNKDAASFFKMQNFSKAQQYVESYLEAKNIDYSVPTAVINL